MTTWKNHPVWLRGFRDQVPEHLRTPEEIAAFETANFRGQKQPGGNGPDDGGSGEKIRILTSGKGEGYRIRKENGGYVVSGGSPGILYGVYALTGSLLAGEQPEEGYREPENALRIIECWDNMDGSIERGYSGRSLWFDGGGFSYEPERIRQLGRMLASVGINTLCINNVNVRDGAQRLLDDLLPDAAKFSSILRPFGIRLMFSVDFSQPVQDGTGTADPLDPDVALWWSRRAERIWEAIPDFAGFLVKADSEHRPGPNTYGRTHAEGANMLAEAVDPYGGVIVWRAFVYNCMQDWRDSTVDRPCAAYNVYKPLDGLFRDNVILQVKYGPFDFQVREPVSPLLLRMEHTNMAVEFQLAQEYTGHQVDLFAMPSMWKEIFGEMSGRKTHSAAAVSNLGRDANWTGHPFAALNLFAFGIFAWDRNADPEKVIRRWIALTYGFRKEDEDTLLDILTRSRAAYEKYTSPLGLCWMVNPGEHYGPSPYGYEFQAWGTYNRADRNAVGIDRTKDGTGYVLQYPEGMRSKYEDPETCPDELLLFFHRLPYTFRMKDGRTLIQRIYDDHFEGYEEAVWMGRALDTLPLPECDREEAAERMSRQLRNAAEWRDVVNTFFLRFSGIPDEKGRRIWP